MKLIVGLGNPGEKYEKTRHNFGYMALDTLLEKFQPVEKTFWQKSGNAQIKEIMIKRQKVFLAKPLTFMNDSGKAVSDLLRQFSLKIDDLIVIHDDLDLPIGKIKVRFAGSGAGHKGVQSIIDSLNSDKFLRIRLGIGKEARTQSFQAAEDYVLSDFSSHEISEVKHVLKEIVKITQLLLKEGLDKYMSKYNKK